MVRESAKMQELGPKRYREMIEKSRKAAMDNPNIIFKPVSFPKLRGGSKLIVCSECGADLIGTKFTYMIICSVCKFLVTVD